MNRKIIKMSVRYDFERRAEQEMNFSTFMTAETIPHIYFGKNK